MLKEVRPDFQRHGVDSVVLTAEEENPFFCHMYETRAGKLPAELLHLKTFK